MDEPRDMHVFNAPLRPCPSARLRAAVRGPAGFGSVEPLMRAAAACIALAMAGLFAGPAAAGDDTVRPIAAPRAVIELFTSQGCSSCPPADKLMGEFAERADVLGLTLAVDYWDYLGWKDTLAKHGHSLRQKAYAKLRRDSKMFTPQAVVNGRVMAIGSDRAMLERTLATIDKPAVPVEIAARDGRIHVTVGRNPGGALSGEVWLCPVASKMDVDIGRGENEGTKISYHNVVRGWIKLGDWNGGEARFDTALRAQSFDADSVAVLVQSGSSTEPGPILGAALLPLP